MAGKSGNNNVLYMVLGGLLVAVLGLGYMMLSGKSDEPTLSIDVTEDGIDIDTN